MLFEALPNEVISHVFSYLKIVDILKCGQVSKRLRAISIDDQYVWPKMLNLCYKKVPVKFLQRLLDSGCKYLSLSEAILEGTLNLPKASRLNYLNLFGFGRKNRNNLEKLLESCYSLQKLSLSAKNEGDRYHLSLKLINSISLQNSKTLRVLDLSYCSLCPNLYNCNNCEYTCGIQQIVKNCIELKELSLHKTTLHVKSIDILVSNLTSKIEKLDLFDMHNLKDEHVNILVTRCNKITELNLGGWTSITKHSLNFISEHLKSTLVKLTLGATAIRFDLNDILELKNMEKLKLFYYDPSYDAWRIDKRRMEKLMPNVWVDFYSEKQRIACPSKQEFNGFWFNFNHLHGFWEIKAERENLFNENWNMEYGEIVYDKISPPTPFTKMSMSSETCGSPIRKVKVTLLRHFGIVEGYPIVDALNQVKIQRFDVPQGLLNYTNLLLADLMVKFKSLFQAHLQINGRYHGRNKIFWQDKDSDLVRIVSDEELILGITEMEQDGIYEFFVVPNHGMINVT